MAWLHVAGLTALPERCDFGEVTSRLCDSVSCSGRWGWLHHPAPGGQCGEDVPGGTWESPETSGLAGSLLRIPFTFGLFSSYREECHAWNSQLLWLQPSRSFFQSCFLKTFFENSFIDVESTCDNLHMFYVYNVIKYSHMCLTVDLSST